MYFLHFESNFLIRLSKYFSTLLFFLLCSSAFSQVAYDSLHTKVDRAEKPRKKLEVYLYETVSIKLTIEDFEKLTNEITVLGKKIKKSAYADVIISCLYFNQEDFDKAMEFANRALQKAELEKDTVTLGFASMRIANCFFETGNKKKQLEYYRLAATHYLKIPITSPYNKLKDIYTAMGNWFKDQHQLDSALYYQKKSLELAIRTKDRKQQAYSYNNIGLVYNKMEQLDRALEFYEMSALIKKELGDRGSLSGTLINKGNLLCKLHKTAEALKSYKEGIKMAEETGRSNFLLNGLKDLADLQITEKNFKEAATTYQKYERLWDSVNTLKEKKNLDDIAAKYETEKKDAEIVKGREDIKNQELIIAKQKQFNYAIGAGLILAFISIAVVLRSYYLNKKFSKDLAAQKNLIEEKNKEITDSINYAQRIQESLFTAEELFKENSKEFFVLFQPKDIVSGDFYWANKNTDGFLVMCGDCTGHGVPGAFMSLLGMSYLNDIVTQSGIHQPNSIFNELRDRIVKNLNQKDEARKDGMDASLIKIKGMTLEFACSNNPIWIIREKKIIKFKADKCPLGMGVHDNFSFTHSTYDLKNGDTIFMFTDGYADQFGGPNGKKFKVKQLEEKMLEIDHLSMHEQKNILHEHFINWKGEQGQVDDVLVIGIRV